MSMERVMTAVYRARDGCSSVGGHLILWKRGLSRAVMSHFLEIIKEFGRRLGWWGAIGLSALLAVTSVLLAAFIVVGWPADQFRGPDPPPFWERRHPIVRGLGIVGKNVAGLLIVVLGVIMALPGVPGQGLLLILIGLTLINFPGKRRLENRLIRRPAILRLINSARRRFSRPPLELD